MCYYITDKLSLYNRRDSQSPGQLSDLSTRRKDLIGVILIQNLKSLNVNTYHVCEYMFQQAQPER